MITNKNKTFTTIPKFHTNCHFEKHRPKRGPSYRMQVLHPRPQSPQGEPVAKPGTLLLIILSNPAELFAGCQGNASVCVIVTSQMLLLQHCDVIHAHDAVDGVRMDTLLAKWGHVLNATQPLFIAFLPLQWRHNGHDSVSNHQRHDCLLNRLFKAQIKETIKASRHWPLCGEFTGGRLIPRTNGQ